MHILFVIFSALIGLCVGSFLNCLIWRLHKEESIFGRSYCPHCSKQIAWYDNIPLLSFIILKGRCRYCREAISWQYPLVELMTGLLFMLSFVVVAALPDFPLLLARNWLLIATFIIVLVYDARFQMVPMLVVWPMIAIAAVISYFLDYTVFDILIFGIAGALFFIVQYLATNKKGIGEGDIWLGLLLGVSLPQLSLLALALILAYFSGTIVSVFLLLSQQKNWKSKIALGPFLSFGAIITIIFGSKIINWYLGLF
jgi:leader peptidase (prepilin peptidase) / N-methyltransferase